MKLAIDARSLATTPMTGVGSYTLSFLERLASAKERYPVEIFLFTSGSGANRSLLKMISALPFPHVQIRVPNKLLNAWLASGVGSGLISLLPEHDALWMPNLNFVSFHSATPLYITIHDLSFLHNERFYSYKNRLWHRALRVRGLLERATMLFPVSTHTALDIKRFFPALRTPTRVINPGLHSVLSSDPSRSFRLPRKFLLYVGTLEPRKNLLGILTAFQMLRRKHTDLSLVLAGQMHNLQASVRSLIREGGGIEYRSYVSSDEKKELYKNALALLWPSLYEGFGFPPLEALAYGTPVITSYRTSLPEILRTSVWYVNPYNIAEYVRVVEHLLSCKRLEIAPPSYSWERCVDQTLRAMLETYANRR